MQPKTHSADSNVYKVEQRFPVKTATSYGLFYGFYGSILLGRDTRAMHVDLFSKYLSIPELYTAH